MGKLKRASRTNEDGVVGYGVPTKDGGEMFIPELERGDEAGFLPTKPSAYEVEKAHYDMWLWELTKYDDIHLIRELEGRGYDVRRAA